MMESDLVRIPKFLKRLYRETTDPTNTYIQWSADGERIRIENKAKFIKHTLPMLSRTKEYSAFIRQLNIYGFIKIKNEKSDEIEEYYNSFFKRDEPNLMEYIKRLRKFEKTETKLSIPSMENSVAYLTEANYRLSNEIAQLKERMDKQERTISGLMEILGKVFRTGVQTINSQNNVSEIKNEYPFEIFNQSFHNEEHQAQCKNLQLADLQTRLSCSYPDKRQEFATNKRFRTLTDAEINTDFPLNLLEPDPIEKRSKKEIETKKNKEEGTIPDMNSLFLF